MTTVGVHPDAEAAARAAAEAIGAALGEAREQRGAAHLALAGGSTPRRAYELLASELSDWDGIEIWFGDERAVGPDDPESNYRLARETLVEAGGPAISQVHRIEGERGAEAAASAYADLLAERLPATEDGIPILDLALQGLGPDGHTASLFPGNPALEASGVCVPVHDAPKPPPDRITLTFAALRAARRLIFLVTGASKAEPVAALLDSDPSIPAGRLAGSAELICDAAAAPDRG